jgi:hypothetical protein
LERHVLNLVLEKFWKVLLAKVAQVELDLEKAAFAGTSDYFSSLKP